MLEDGDADQLTRARGLNVCCYFYLTTTDGKRINTIFTHYSDVVIVIPFLLFLFSISLSLSILETLF